MRYWEWLQQPKPILSRLDYHAYYHHQTRYKASEYTKRKLRSGAPVEYYWQKQKAYINQAIFKERITDFGL